MQNDIPSKRTPSPATTALSPVAAAAAATAMKPVTATSPASRRWNTKDLPYRFGSDLASAASAASVIAPIITIIDRSIMESTSGRAASISSSILTSVRQLIRHPLKALFSRPVGLVFLLYGGTYLTANALDTVSSTLANRPASSTTSGPAKFAASSAANVSLCVYKDQAFVRIFGPPQGTTPRPVPLPCYAIFAFRDCLTIFASFNVPPLMAPYIDAYTRSRANMSGLTAAQFMAPAAIQLISTPLHLLGLDLYNRPSIVAGTASISMSDRWQLIKNNWLVSATARICRIVPAFGVGGVINFKVRNAFMTGLD